MCRELAVLVLGLVQRSIATGIWHQASAIEALGASSARVPVLVVYTSGIGVHGMPTAPLLLRTVQIIVRFVPGVSAERNARESAQRAVVCVAARILVVVVVVLVRAAARLVFEIVLV